MAEKPQRSKKSQKERIVFVRYAKAARLPTTGATIESRVPPEPDILFTPAKGRPIAFELVEVLDQGYSRSLNRQLNTADFCYAYLDKYSDAPAFRRKYPDADIYLAFSPESSERKRKNILPKLFEKLLALPDGTTDEVLENDPELRPTLEYARILRGRFKGPCFNATAAVWVGDPTVDALKDKFSKSYTTPHRLELVAYIDNAAMFPDDVWLPRLGQFFDSLTSAPFAAIHVFDLRGGRDEIRLRWAA
jgi:hypothetical protein